MWASFPRRVRESRRKVASSVPATCPGPVSGMGMRCFHVLPPATGYRGNVARRWENTDWRTRGMSGSASTTMPDPTGDKRTRTPLPGNERLVAERSDARVQRAHVDRHRVGDRPNDGALVVRFHDNGP